MTNVIQYALQMSNLKWIESGYKEQPLNTAEAFYLATKGSGEFFGRVGSFEEGYDFDALVIDDNSDKYFKELSIEERLQKFIYSDDFTHIKVRYVAGKVVSEPNI
jgi:guanine deaminase